MSTEQIQAAALEKANQAKAMAEAAFNKAKEEGYFSGFAEYNVEILRPLKRVNEFSIEAVKAEVMGTLTFKPPNPEASFIFYNVMALLWGIFESVFAALFDDSGWMSLLWNGAFAYIFAYTVYWIMLCFQDVTFMMYTLVLLAAYCAFNIYMSVSTLLFVVPAIACTHKHRRECPACDARGRAR